MTDWEQVQITTATASRLKKARLDCGLSQQDVATRIEASVAPIEQYEHGGIDMPVDRLFDLAALLQVSAAELLAD